MDRREYLRKLGMGEYSARVLDALFNGERLDAKQISEGARVPYTKVYAGLQMLCERGLVEERQGHPKLFWVNDPKKIIDFLLERKRKELEGLKAYREEFLECAKALCITRNNIRVECIVQRTYPLSTLKPMYRHEFLINHSAQNFSLSSNS